jgi:hypothetical protein
VIVCLGLYTGPGTFELVGDDMTYYGSETKYGGRGQIDWNIILSGSLKMYGPELRGTGANGATFTITDTGRATIVGDLTSSLSFINYGLLSVADGKRLAAIKNGHQFNGTITVGAASVFTVNGGWSKWHGRINMVALADITFIGVGPHDIGAVDFRMNETARIYMDNCQVRFVVACILNITQLRTWSDKSVTVTAMVPVIVRITKQFAQWPEAGICGGGDSCYGGGKR